MAGHHVVRAIGLFVLANAIRLDDIDGQSSYEQPCTLGSVLCKCKSQPLEALPLIDGTERRNGGVRTRFIFAVDGRSFSKMQDKFGQVTCTDMGKSDIQNVHWPEGCFCNTNSTLTTSTEWKVSTLSECLGGFPSMCLAKYQICGDERRLDIGVAWAPWSAPDFVQQVQAAQGRQVTMCKEQRERRPFQWSRNVFCTWAPKSRKNGSCLSALPPRLQWFPSKRRFDERKGFCGQNMKLSKCMKHLRWEAMQGSPWAFL
eukprot:TRINITY_DN72107_c0_g1_i1.p1 TRINITY_DN72107_c0_g1~~TRINITY_DN72107_c0_g1_i1.p1  ORF type:complete len:272 (-),score=25.43 TRINITY_DN72107_c0_g1_i1:84-857(-)